MYDEPIDTMVRKKYGDYLLVPRIQVAIGKQYGYQLRFKDDNNDKVKKKEFLERAFYLTA